MKWKCELTGYHFYYIQLYIGFIDLFSKVCLLISEHTSCQQQNSALFSTVKLNAVFKGVYFVLSYCTCFPFRIFIWIWDIPILISLTSNYKGIPLPGVEKIKR